MGVEDDDAVPPDSEVRSIASAMAWTSSRAAFERDRDADNLYEGG